MSTTEDNSWHLDKKVPISLIFAISVQLLAWVWVASGMNTRIEHLEERDAENREVNKIVYGLQADIQNIKDSLTRIERAVIEDD